MADLHEMDEAPNFKSNVPEVVRHSMSKDEFQTWLADTLSVNDQRVEWLIRKVIELNNTVVKNDAQITRWKKWVENPVAVFIALAIWVGPLTVSKAIDYAGHKKEKENLVAPVRDPRDDDHGVQLDPKAR